VQPQVTVHLDSPLDDRVFTLAARQKIISL